MSELKLIQTCGACPEQYDVTQDGRQVGYLRLRHGWFYAACPDVGGDIVYESEPKGDGIFEDYERPIEIEKALAAIREWVSNNPPLPNAGTD